MVRPQVCSCGLTALFFVWTVLFFLPGSLIWPSTALRFLSAAGPLLPTPISPCSDRAGWIKLSLISVPQVTSWAYLDSRKMDSEK